MGSCQAVQTVEECKDFGQGAIELLGDQLPQVKSGQDLHQIRVLMNRDAMLPGQGKDPLGDMPLARGHETRRGVFFGIVTEGYRPFARLVFSHGSQ